MEGIDVMRKTILSSLAGISLLCCLASPLFYFLGKLSEKNYRWIFLLASISWFLFATLRISLRKRDKRSD
jgi:uncharacterized membrane protein (GlpM family)